MLGFLTHKHLKSYSGRKGYCIVQIRIFTWLINSTSAEEPHIFWKVEICSDSRVTICCSLPLLQLLGDITLSLFLRPNCQEGSSYPLLTRCEAYLAVANASLTFWKGPSYASSWVIFLPQELIKFLISDMLSLANAWKASMKAAVILHLSKFITS